MNAVESAYPVKRKSYQMEGGRTNYREDDTWYNIEPHKGLNQPNDSELSSTTHILSAGHVYNFRSSYAVTKNAVTKIFCSTDLTDGSITGWVRHSS